MHLLTPDAPLAVLFYEYKMIAVDGPQGLEAAVRIPAGLAAVGGKHAVRRLPVLRHLNERRNHVVQINAPGEILLGVRHPLDEMAFHALPLVVDIAVEDKAGARGVAAVQIGRFDLIAGDMIRRIAGQHVLDGVHSLHSLNAALLVSDEPLLLLHDLTEFFRCHSFSPCAFTNSVASLPAARPE